MRKLALSGIGVVLLTLAACSPSEPSDNDVYDALAKFDTGEQMFGSREKMPTQMKKVSCEKAGEKSFKCLIGSPDGKGMNLPFTFTKADSGWVASPGG